MNTKDLKRHFFIVLTHAENCRCEDLHHKASNRHEIGEECKAQKKSILFFGIVIAITTMVAIVSPEPIAKIVCCAPADATALPAIAAPAAASAMPCDAPISTPVCLAHSAR